MNIDLLWSCWKTKQFYSIDVAASFLKQVYTKSKKIKQMYDLNCQQVHSIATKYTGLNAWCVFKISNVMGHPYRWTFGDPVHPDVKVFLNLHAVPWTFKKTNYELFSSMQLFFFFFWHHDFASALTSFKFLKGNVIKHLMQLSKTSALGLPDYDNLKQSR